MNKKVLLSGVAVGLIIVIFVFVAIFINNQTDDTSEPFGKASVNEPGDSNAKTEQPSEGKVDTETSVITYTDQGFSPSTLTVKVGTTIRVVNNSSDALEFSSDNHPTHLDNSELNMDVLAVGESSTFTVTKSGEHGFHDHLNASNEGILTVTE